MNIPWLFVNILYLRFLPFNLALVWLDLESNGLIYFIT